jgi:hypothetical protein
VEDIFLKLDDEFVDCVEQRLLKEHFTSYLEMLLDLLDDGSSTTTNAFIHTTSTLHEASRDTRRIFCRSLFRETIGDLL